jgi:membrane-associated phospholipid phosphatase
LNASRLTAVAALSAAFIGLTLLVTHRWSRLTTMDRTSVVHLRQVDAHSALFLDAMRVVSAVVSGPGWVIVLGSLTVWLVWQHLLHVAAFVAVTGLGSPILNGALKDLVHRPRPVLARPVDVAGGWSFPSGHAQSATVGCAVLLVVFLPSLGRVASRWAVVAAVSLVAVVGLSRMALGVHYPSDVVAAVLCGSAWTLITACVFLPADAPVLCVKRFGSGR